MNGIVDPSDVELLEAWVRGDTVAGNRLVRRHFDALFRFFRSRVDEGVADLVQQTFLACIETSRRIPEQAGFRAWLFGIARNKLLLHQRSHGRRRDAVGADALLDAEADASSELSIGGLVDMRDEQRLLLRGLRRLPLDLQVALVLSYWEGLSGTEIAEVLETPVGTVKTRIRRARELLKTTILSLAPGTDTATVTVRDLDRWASSLRERLAKGD
jgi:RNA polymerase sigma-70 factor (ECF subfamily)